MFEYKKYNDYELLYLYNRHSEEALQILLKKYEALIEIKLYSFHIASFHREDYKQECMLVLMKAIKRFDDSFNKSFYRYTELIIERKIMNLLRDEVRRSIKYVLIEDSNLYSSSNDLEQTISYQRILTNIAKCKLTGIKEDILKEIYFEGMSIEQFSQKHNLSKKDVYNHIYLLRLKLKKELL